MPAIAGRGVFHAPARLGLRGPLPFHGAHRSTRKLPIYARAGIPFAWLVDPVERLVEVLQLRDGVWSIAGVRGDTEVVRLDPFGAIEVALARLWGDPVAPASPPEGTDK